TEDDMTELPSEPGSIRLDRAYDATALARELAELESVERLSQPGPYHNGEWKGISLVSLGGKPSARSSTAGLEGYAPCAVLDAVPSFRSVLDGLACPKQVVRLLWLPPGGKIGEHKDSAVGFAAGQLRLHVPIVTHPDVVFMLGGERVRWGAGELWYGDFE